MNIGSGNGLLPDSTKPLPILVYHQWDPLTITWGQSQSSIIKVTLKITCLKFHSNLTRANELMTLFLCNNLGPITIQIIHAKSILSEITQNLVFFPCGLILRKFCTEHCSMTVMLCAKFQKDLLTEPDVKFCEMFILRQISDGLIT